MERVLESVGVRFPETDREFQHGGAGGHVRSPSFGGAHGLGAGGASSLTPGTRQELGAAPFSFRKARLKE